MKLFYFTSLDSWVLFAKIPYKKASLMSRYFSSELEAYNKVNFRYYFAKLLLFGSNELSVQNEKFYPEFLVNIGILHLKSNESMQY